VPDQRASLHSFAGLGRNRQSWLQGFGGGFDPLPRWMSFYSAPRFRSTSAMRIHPHSLRHSTAVHLLKSGVDLSTIAHWLGHSSINTTHKYVTIDLEVKRAVIAKAEPIAVKSAKSLRWKTDEDLLQWLQSL
jgi:integrase